MTDTPRTETLAAETTRAVLAALSNRRSGYREPTMPHGARQPLHTVYGGAHLFKATTLARLGELARAQLREYAPDARTLAEAVGMEGGAALAEAVYARVEAKLEREPVEDYRIDFEDGFGLRSDADEDAAALRTADELALAYASGSLPPFIGIRVKSLGNETAARAIRTLDRFLTRLVAATGGQVPEHFVVTLPKVMSTNEVAALAELLDALERDLGLARGAVGVELMVELAEAIVDSEGRNPLRRLVEAAAGRCVAVHFGSYDYTASLGIAAAHQSMTHPACDHAKHAIAAALAGTAIRLSDGATAVLPTPPHRGASLGPEALAENRAVVHAAWRLAYRNVRHSLVGGFYQGWDLHPGQIPIRYAAAFAFFLEALEPAVVRLAGFLADATRARRTGSTFDDAATGQGLLNFFSRARAAGAIDDRDLARAGLTPEELGTRSFAAILASRTER